MGHNPSDELGQPTDQPDAGNDDVPPVTDPYEDDEPLNLSRRSALRLAGGSIAAALATTAISDPVQAATVIDLGEEGLSEGDLIDPYLESFFTDDTEVHVPEGTYRWGGTNHTLGNAALIGDGAGVTFDMGDGFRASPDFVATDGTVRFENITQRGAVQLDEDNHTNFGVHAEAGATLELVNFNRPDGTTGTGRASGWYVHGNHAGTVVFRNCTVAGFTDNGLYGSAPGEAGNPDGAVIVEGGLYKNNNVASVRVGSDDSVVRNVTILHDEPIPDKPQGTNGRGIWIREGGENITIEDCDITFLSGSTDSTSPIRLQDRNGGGSGVVRNCRVRQERSSDPIDYREGSWTGSGNHLTGDGDLSVSSDVERWIECSGGSCDEPTTQKQWVGDAEPAPETLSVSTATATDVTSEEATLNGTLNGLGDANAADVGFEYRNVGASTWRSTSLQRLSSPASYEETLSLESGDEIEYRAYAVASDGLTDTGTTVDVTAADKLEIVPTGSEPVEYEFTVDGSVTLVTAGDNSSDGDETLTENDDGTVTVSDSTGGGDAFRVASEFLSMTVGPNGAYELLLNGDAVTVEELVGSGTKLTFQEGVDGYRGTADTYLQEDQPTVDNSDATELNVDANDPHGSGQDVHALLRFDDIIGENAVLPGATVHSATLTIETTHSGDGASLHRMVSPWSETDAWNTFGGDGVQADGAEAATDADATVDWPDPGPTAIDVTESVQAWADGEPNHGWALLPVGGDGWDFGAAEGSSPPTLTVWFEGGDEPIDQGTSIQLQEGVDGYHGTADTYLQEDQPAVDNADAPVLNVDANDPHGSGQDVHALLRFDDLIGVDTVLPGATVHSATLTIETRHSGDGAAFHRMVTPWSETDTWDTFGGDGIQADGSEAATAADASVDWPDTGPTDIDVTESVQAWADGEPNHGWALLPVGGDGWDFGGAESSSPPTLTVSFEGGDSTGSAPRVDRFEVTEMGSPNPHADIVAEWDVSDRDGDLVSATVEVRDSSGSLVADSTSSLSGGTHYGVDYLEIKHVDGETFEVTVTVSDAAGRQASASREVME